MVRFPWLTGFPSSSRFTISRTGCRVSVEYAAAWGPDSIKTARATDIIIDLFNIELSSLERIRRPRIFYRAIAYNIRREFTGLVTRA
jgi:hypothetical protein